MAITKEKKAAIIAKLEQAFAEANAVAFVGFSKLTVASASALRSELRKAGVRYFVAKKTLIRKALADRGFAGTLPELPGEVAIAWSTDDVLAPSREVYEFGKKLKGVLTLLGGVFENTFADEAQVMALATIPPLPVLRGMFVNVINSPIQGLVVSLDKIREQRSGA